MRSHTLRKSNLFTLVFFATSFRQFSGNLSHANNASCSYTKVSKKKKKENGLGHSVARLLKHNPRSNFRRRIAFEILNFPTLYIKTKKKNLNFNVIYFYVITIKIKINNLEILFSEPIPVSPFIPHLIHKAHQRLHYSSWCACKLRATNAPRERRIPYQSLKLFRQAVRTSRACAPNECEFRAVEIGAEARNEIEVSLSLSARFLLLFRRSREWNSLNAAVPHSSQKSLSRSS